jgi:DNA-binding CsgD family transcriptional regulator
MFPVLTVTARTEISRQLPSKTHHLVGEPCWCQNRAGQGESPSCKPGEVGPDEHGHDAPVRAAGRMQAFAERARRELRAAGETVRKRAAATHGELTPQEAQIAWLARSGLSNPQIAAQLFLSPRTVQYHLAKVFSKLEISSRRQLERALPDSANAGLSG